LKSIRAQFGDVYMFEGINRPFVEMVLAVSKASRKGVPTHSYIHTPTGRRISFDKLKQQASSEPDDKFFCRCQKAFFPTAKERERWLCTANHADLLFSEVLYRNSGFGFELDKTNSRWCMSLNRIISTKVGVAEIISIKDSSGNEHHVTTYK